MPNDNINDQGNMTNPNTSRWIIWTDGQDRGSIITHYFIEFSTNFDPKWRVHPDGNSELKVLHSSHTCDILLM